MISRIQASISYQLLFILAFCVFIIALAIVWNINDVNYQSRSFEHYNIPAKTGLNVAELTEIAESIRGYFNTIEEPLNVKFPHSPNHPVFTAKEISHMHDVKKIIHYVYLILLLTFLFLLGTIVGYLRSPVTRKRLSQMFALSSALTLGITILFGLSMLIAFDKMFLIFHLISFNNDDWILNPYTDYLLIMYPQPFWFSVSVRVGVIIIILSIISLIISLYFNRKIT